MPFAMYERFGMVLALHEDTDIDGNQMPRISQYAQLELDYLDLYISWNPTPPPLPPVPHIFNETIMDFILYIDKDENDNPYLLIPTCGAFLTVEDVSVNPDVIIVPPMLTILKWDIQANSVSIVRKLVVDAIEIGGGRIIRSPFNRVLGWDRNNPPYFEFINWFTPKIIEKDSQQYLQFVFLQMKVNENNWPAGGEPLYKTRDDWDAVYNGVGTRKVGLIYFSLEELRNYISNENATIRPDVFLIYDADAHDDDTNFDYITSFDYAVATVNSNTADVFMLNRSESRIGDRKWQEPQYF